MDILGEFLQTLKTRTAKQAGYIFISSVAAKFVAFLSMVVLVRSLSVEQYGMLSTAISIAALFSGLLFAGLNTTMTRFGALFLKKKDVKASLLFSTTFWIEMLIALISLILGWASSPYIAEYAFRKAFLAPFIRGGFFIGLGMVLANYAFSFFQTHERFKGYSLLTFSYSFLTFAAVYILAKLGMLTLNFALFAYIYAPFIVFIGASNLILKQGLAPKINMQLFSELWAFGKWVIFGSLFSIIFSQIPTMFLTRYASIGEVGMFGFAYNLYGATLLLLTAINTVLFPKISKITDKEKISTAIKMILKTTSFIALLLIPVIFFTKPLILIIVGEKYLGAILMIKILAVSAMISIILSPISLFIYVVNRPDVQAKIYFIVLLIALPISFKLVQYAGGVGAAVSLLVIFLLSCALPGLWLYKYLKNNQ